MAGLSTSSWQAFDDLKLERLLVVYPGSRGYELSDRIRVVQRAEALGCIIASR